MIRIILEVLWDEILLMLKLRKRIPLDNTIDVLANASIEDLDQAVKDLKACEAFGKCNMNFHDC